LDEWALLILTIVDSIGFIPTIRKSFAHPFDENLTFFTLLMVRNFIAVFALSTYSLTTILFPVAMGFASFIPKMADSLIQ
jgi:hypothetical protein